MSSRDPSERVHRRLNPLTGRHVLVSTHRTSLNKKPSRTPLVVGIIVAILVIGAVLAVLFLKR